MTRRATTQVTPILLLKLEIPSIQICTTRKHRSTTLWKYTVSCVLVVHCAMCSGSSVKKEEDAEKSTFHRCVGAPSVSYTGCASVSSVSYTLVARLCRTLVARLFRLFRTLVEQTKILGQKVRGTMCI